MAEKMTAQLWAKAVAGALAGTVVGYMGTLWAWQYGLYTIVLPGACIGLCASLLVRRRCVPCGILCAALALPVTLWTQYRLIPIRMEWSFWTYLTHAHQILLPQKLMILLGVVFAFWIGEGVKGPREEQASEQEQVEATEDQSD